MSYSTCLYKSLTPAQFAGVIQSDWRELAAESPDQKMFYPKLNRQYAEMVARMLNLAHYNAAYVVKFNVNALFLARYEIQTVAYDEHQEYKIPIEDLPLLNCHIVGIIEVVSAFTLKDCQKPPLIEGLMAAH